MENPQPNAEAVQTKTAIVIVMYMLCSSTMLIFNKIYCGGVAGKIKVDALEAGKIKAFSMVVVIFMLNIYTNIKALENSNVETVIVFQTLTSLVIAYGDYKVLKSGMPSSKVILSLGIIVLGALCYMYSDSEFKMDTYFWVFAYFFAKTVDMIYTKHIVDTVPMTSWGRSFYNNFLSMIPWFFLAIVNERSTVVRLYYDNEISSLAVIVLIMSCLVGIGISIVGFMAREAISATSFSVVGNMNKVLTVFINFYIWDKHASMQGLLSLCICLVGGAYYAKAKG